MTFTPYIMAEEPLTLRQWNTGPKIYLGNLGEKADKFKIAELFKVYGKLKNVIVAKNTPGFAFVEFEDPKAAEKAYNDIYGEHVSASGLPVGMKKWAPKPGTSSTNMLIKPPSETRPEDWLCPKDGCNNINFEWRKSCNNCNTKKPGYDGETDDERKQRVYGGSRADKQNYNSEFSRDRSRSYERDGGRHRGRGQGPDHNRDRDWERGRQTNYRGNQSRGYPSDRRGRGRRS